MRKVEETSLKYSHEEVDSPMLFHAKFINAPKNMSYEQLITLCNIAKLFQGLKAWLEVGLTSNNTLRYISMNKISQGIEHRLCCALPAYHASLGTILLHRLNNAMGVKLFSELGEKKTVNKK